MRPNDDAIHSRQVRLRTGPILRCSERGAGDEPVLLLHGYSDSAHTFAPVLPLLPARWRVLAPDQRGHGDSDRPQGGYTMEQLAADAAALLDATGAGAATVVGHSMGSLVALRLALDHPERVARLVLVGSTPSAKEAMHGLAQEIAAFADPVPVAFVRGFQESAVCRPVPAAFFEQVVAESRKLPARVWQAIAADLARFDVRAELGRVRCPTLLVWGDRDAFFGRAEQEALRDGIPGASLLVYEGTGHTPHWEEPERFARDLTAFVA